MKRIFVATLSLLLLASGTFVARKSLATNAITIVRADEGERCTLAGLAGNYGFTISGTLVLPTGDVSVAGVGLATVGADGSFSGTESRSIGGAIAQETISGGLLSVNPDCTGTLTSPVFESGSLVRTSGFSLVFDDNGKGGRALQTSLVVPGGASLPNVITVELTKVSTPDHD